MLTVDDIAARMCVSQRTAHRFAAAWSERQHDSRVPRVSRVRIARTGRPRYVVDRESFERWLCPALAAQAA